MKITYIISRVDKAIAFEWIYSALNENFDFSFIFIGEKQGFLFHWLKKKNVPVFFVPYYGKTDLPFAFIKIVRFLIQIRPNLIHTHLFEANILGLTAAKVIGIKKRIYSRHHSTFHHDFFPKAVKYDRLCNFMATDIVAISKLVRSVLVEQENVNPAKVSLIEHGFKLSRFLQVDKQQIVEMKKKYFIPDNKIIVGVISRYMILKGLRYVIGAFKKLIETNNKIHLVLANANGPDAKMIQKELSFLPKGSYSEIAFEKDLFTLYGMFDVFVHCPIDNKVEAFGQTYVEALASGVPSVFTLSGIANDFIIHERNALVVDYKNKEQIAKAIERLLSDKKLACEIINNGISDVEMFSLDNMIHKLKLLYKK